MSAEARGLAAVDLRGIVEEMVRGGEGLVRRTPATPCAEPRPVREEVHRIVEELRAAIFPGYFGDSGVRREDLEYHLGSTLARVRRSLEDQVKRGLCFTCAGDRSPERCERDARDGADRFFARLPEIQRLLAKDVDATWIGDPAATSPDEAIFCYPGIQALTSYRIAHELHRLGVPILPRMITEQAHGATGIDIHPGATIGEGIFIDHGTGVVVGETCEIGRRVKLYQGVTLGAKSFPLDEKGNPIKGIPRHPIIGDDVVIYSGATILGRVTIGAGSVIGGNVWLTEDVPPGSRVLQQRPRESGFTAGGGI